MIIYLILFFLLGAAIGSFIHAWVTRAQQGRDPFFSRSVCESCDVVIAWYDLVPIASFLVLQGKCRNCREPIHNRHVWVELLTGILFMIAAWQYWVPTLDLAFLARDLFIITLLVGVGLCDLLYEEIPTTMVWWSAVVLFIAHSVFGVFPWTELVIGAAAAGGFFFLQHAVSKGQWIGGGDITLGILLGALFGWPGAALAILLGYVIGAVVSVFLLFAGRLKSNRAPFGMYLSSGATVMLFVGDHILGVL